MYVPITSENEGHHLTTVNLVVEKPTAKRRSSFFVALAKPVPVKGRSLGLTFLYWLI